MPQRAAWALFTGGAAASQQAYAVYRTTDGGKTWAPMLASHWPAASDVAPGVTQTIDAYAGPFAVVDADTAFFAGRCAPCYNVGTSSITRTTDGGLSWQHDEIAFIRQVKALAFADARNGWLVAEMPGGSLILHTGDGGKTWRVQYPADALRPARAVAMVDDRVGYGTGAPGNAGALLKTIDGGATWQQIAQLPVEQPRLPGLEHAFALSFPDAGHGWATTIGGHLLETRDGGITWSERRLPAVITAVRGVSFASPEAGCLEAAIGSTLSRYFSSTDGGATWQDADGTGGVADCAKRLTASTVTPPSGISGDWFLLDARPNGTAWVQQGDEALWVTHDSGKTWQELAWPRTFDARVQSLSSTSPGHGWAVTLTGQFVHLVDSDSHWSVR